MSNLKCTICNSSQNLCNYQGELVCEDCDHCAYCGTTNNEPMGLISERGINIILCPECTMQVIDNKLTQEFYLECLG